MESHCLHFAYSEVGHPGTMTYRRGLLYYIIMSWKLCMYKHTYFLSNFFKAIYFRKNIKACVKTYFLTKVIKNLNSRQSVNWKSWSVIFTSKFKVAFWFISFSIYIFENLRPKIYLRIAVETFSLVTEYLRTALIVS